MIYRKKCELETVPIEGCMGGKGTVKMEKLLCAPEEMMGKGRAYVRHILNPGVSIGMHTHEGEMETMVIISGKAGAASGGRGYDRGPAGGYPWDRPGGNGAFGTHCTGPLRLDQRTEGIEKDMNAINDVKG